MSQRSPNQIGVANLVLTTFLLVGLVASNTMNETIPPRGAQCIKSTLPSGDVVTTNRLSGESLDSWRDRHIAALEEFSQ